MKTIRYLKNCFCYNDRPDHGWVDAGVGVALEFGIIVVMGIIAYLMTM